MNNKLEPIQVGEFQIDQNDLFNIVRAYVAGESTEEIATRLNIETSDLVELIAEPKVFEKAIEARKNLLRLMLYGPLADRLITIASGAGDTRSQVAAVKFVKNLIEDRGDPKKDSEQQGSATTKITHNTLNVIGQLPEGGFDAIVRQVEKAQRAQGAKVLDVTSKVIDE